MAKGTIQGQFIYLRRGKKSDAHAQLSFNSGRKLPEPCFSALQLYESAGVLLEIQIVVQ
jgi:hypothetical protein